MKMIRGRRDAQWLPSRFNFALFRLCAFLRLRSMRPEPADVALVVDRHQSAAENFVTGGWVWLTLSTLVAGWLSLAWALPWALLCAIPFALAILQILVLLLGGLLRPRGNNLQRNSMLFFMLMTGASLWTVIAPPVPWWARLAGWQFLLVLLLNGVAAIVLRGLRNTLAALEGAVGGLSSEL